REWCGGGRWRGSHGRCSGRGGAQATQRRAPLRSRLFVGCTASRDMRPPKRRDPEGARFSLAHLRGGDDRELRQFLFDRAQFEIVDQDRRRYHTDLSSEASAAQDCERRAVLHVLEDIAVVARSENILERFAIEAAETQSTEELFVPIGEELIDQQRHADGPAAALLSTEQTARFGETCSRWEVHLAHDNAVRLIARLDEIEHLLAQLAHRHELAGTDEEIADGRYRCERASRQPRAPVRTFVAADGLPGEQVALEHALIDEAERLG